MDERDIESQQRRRPRTRCRAVCQRRVSYRAYWTRAAHDMGSERNREPHCPEYHGVPALASLSASIPKSNTLRALAFFSGAVSYISSTVPSVSYAVPSVSYAISFVSHAVSFVSRAISLVSHAVSLGRNPGPAWPVILKSSSRPALPCPSPSPSCSSPTHYPLTCHSATSLITGSGTVIRFWQCLSLLLYLKELLMILTCRSLHYVLHSF
ncbi:hypothetical protein OBBRIDRAFT_829448 [Obba rivulosa]|uniref:Uncharacterized protein n=1 Tax=Obba rivulosa TaxID=1052685 RepID=A0A8E2DF79_9APHY|nr:hypothetical protein OBBRIDRAFT_829448 [Obba rivulosa]